MKTLTHREIVVMIAAMQAIDISKIIDPEVKSVYWKAMSMQTRRTNGTTVVEPFRIES